MKKLILFVALIYLTNSFSQDHFGGISTSKRVGIINIGNNPSELANLSSRFEVQLLATSVNVSNNKIGFKDITSDKNLEDLIFKGNGAVNFNIDSEIAGPGVAIKLLGFGFAITTKANIKANLINVDPTLAELLVNGGDASVLISTTPILNKGNQRLNATVWGEVGLSAARRIYKSDNHKLNAGVTLKFLFPGTYANMGVGNFNGNVVNTLGVLTMTDANANVNIAYSGSLASDFTNINDYTKSLYGPLSGMSGDVGVDYQFKPDGKNYRLKIGAAIKNIGSMTFKGSNNHSIDYSLSQNPSRSLNLNQFENATSITDIENILIANNTNGNINFEASKSQQDFKVKLPTVFNMYADLKVISKLSVTLFMTQKMNANNDNDQINAQNSISLTPRINLGPFEAFVPLTNNEVSGFTGGFGFRLGGFFMGSNSIVTALTSNSKQADFYTGFRFGFL